MEQLLLKVKLDNFEPVTWGGEKGEDYANAQ